MLLKDQPFVNIFKHLIGTKVRENGTRIAGRNLFAKSYLEG
jgi:hypothetical protein